MISRPRCRYSALEVAVGVVVGGLVIWGEEVVLSDGRSGLGVPGDGMLGMLPVGALRRGADFGVKNGRLNFTRGPTTVSSDIRNGTFDMIQLQVQFGK